VKRKDIYALDAAHLRAQAEELAQGAARLRWHLRRMSDDTIKSHAQARVEQLAAESEHFRRSGASHIDSVRKDLERELKIERTRAASLALYSVEPVIRVLGREAESLDRESENAVEVTMPDALDGLDTNGLLLTEVLSELKRPRLQSMSPGALLQEYWRSIDVADAGSYATCSLIEAMVGDVHARNEEERAAVVSLKEEVAAVRQARRPEALTDVASALDQASKAVTTAKMVNVAPLNPIQLGTSQ
jgi:hypothetical protein